MTDFYKKLWSYNDILYKENKYKGWMCIFEGFIGTIQFPVPPFDDHLQSHFPVLEGTKYATQHLLTPQLVEMLGTLSQIPDKDNHYEEKVDYMLSLSLSKELFREHSLYLLKEHCRLFSPYSKKTTELLKKLETL